MIQENLVVSGKRKTAIAKATIKSGTGKVSINRKPMEFFPELQQLELKEPCCTDTAAFGPWDQPKNWYIPKTYPHAFR